MGSALRFRGKILVERKGESENLKSEIGKLKSEI